MSKPWIFLILAGCLEICWAIGLKYTQGFTKLLPSLFTLSTLALSMFFLAKAVETIPIGTGYAIWVGIGAFGAALLGIILFQEPITLIRGFFLVLLLVSILGLKMTSN